MKPTRTTDSAFTVAAVIVLIWVLTATAIGAIYCHQITATVAWWFLLCLFLTASGLLAPVYGGLIYFGARRRNQPRRARAASITTLTLFTLSLAGAAAIIWLLRTLGSVG